MLTRPLGWLVLALAIAVSQRSLASPDQYFAIQVIDEQTNRGVPMVRLETVNNRAFYSDSGGHIAFDEPGLIGTKVFFTITSDGYEFPADGFGIHGTALDTKAGASVVLKIKRINIAQRLYRSTGQGIYRDSVLLGKKPTVAHPLLDGGVLGQDSVYATVYRNRIYWFWGDTNRASYPLGNFHTTGATSLLPAQGGLAPDIGVNLDYFTDGVFVKPMVVLPNKDSNPIWIGGLLTVKDHAGNERMIASYSKVKGMEATLARGLIQFDDVRQQFEPIKSFDVNAPLFPDSHPLPVKVSGKDYYYFAMPYPCVRVRATYDDVIDLSKYEAYTPLKQGTRYQKTRPQLDRVGGKLNWAWKRNTPPLSAMQQKELIDAHLMTENESPFRLTGSDGKPVLAHGGSVCWNDFRKRYIMIFTQFGGTSLLGEVWYAESEKPEGPWTRAVKIATHNKMDLYNPTQHPFFDHATGQFIYFEGTYVNTFSGNPLTVPGYNYNQLMYKLDLADQRLR